jgi:hypothetical protein
LPGRLGRQPCPAALPGSLARQPCPAALPGNRMEWIILEYIRLFKISNILEQRNKKLI